MVFSIRRRGVVPPTQQPLPLNGLIRRISPLALELTAKAHKSGQDTLIRGLQQHASSYEPLQYSYRLQDHSRPRSDHNGLKDTDEQGEVSAAPGAYPISAIVRADMPRQFKAWFHQDDIILFRTRAQSYLAEVARSQKDSERDFRILGQLIKARNQAVLDDTCSYRTARQVLCLAMCIVLLFSPDVVKQRPLTVIPGSILDGLPTSIVIGGQIVWILGSGVRAWVNTLVNTVVQSLVIWPIVFYTFYVAHMCALPFQILAFFVCDNDCCAYWWDIMRSWCGLECVYSRNSTAQLAQQVIRALLEKGTVDEMIHLLDSNPGLLQKPAIANARPYLWLVSYTLDCTWWGDLKRCIQALRSFWAFHRQLPRTSTTSNDTLQKVAGNHAKLLEKGDLLVCLTPYPDLVTVTGLGWLNRMYLSYRAWQRWLLAERVYHTLEMEGGKQQQTLKTAMFKFRPNSGDFDAGDDGLGQEYLFVGMPVIKNEQQGGKWLR
ncbi:hypothetical protein V8F20_006863 [Naviculisporaceae sp. PSN 640]